MRRVTDFPRSVRVIEHTWIPMPDGCRLAARIWLPEDAEQNPVPAILEYIPYRKNDATAFRDAPIHAYFAGHGYASVRVDIRGSGDSDGILEDEYLPLEQDDALAVLGWLAAQPWCTGKVGIIGKSWGGFNGLQIAAHAPRELAAVISVDSTDDRYRDDVHYMGGCVLACFMLSWAATMLALNARPPDPEVVGERWRDIWLDRMDRTPPFIQAWLSHQRRDDYWKQGSVCENYAAISCPVYMVGGWLDGYPSAALRFVEGYPGPCKALIGPWGHLYPQDGAPGPAIGFLQEALRWWDYWLKGKDTGIMDEPKLRLWMQESVDPRPFYEERPGRWISESGWPSDNIEVRGLALGEHTLGAAPPGETQLEHLSALAPAADPGNWAGWGHRTDSPGDQRAEDGQWLTFESDPLTERMEILGAPRLRVILASDTPQAHVAVRLCDVAPNGTSTLITRGVLNLAHRDGHERPSPLVAGERYTVTVTLKAVAYALPAAHRLRVAISSAYWPVIWPAPEPVILTVFTGAESALELPVRRLGVDDDDPPAHFAEPESAHNPEIEVLDSPSAGSRVIRHDVASGVTEIVDAPTLFPAVRLRTSGLEYREAHRDSWRIIDGRPRSAETGSERLITIERGDWQIRIESKSTMSATAEEFHVTDTLEAYEHEQRVFAKTWHLTVGRDHV